MQEEGLLRLSLPPQLEELARPNRPDARRRRSATQPFVMVGSALPGSRLLPDVKVDKYRAALSLDMLSAENRMTFKFIEGHLYHRQPSQPSIPAATFRSVTLQAHDARYLVQLQEAQHLGVVSSDLCNTM